MTFDVLSHHIKIGRVRNSIKARDCPRRAERGDAVHQGGHQGGKQESHDILKRRLQTSCLWRIGISQISGLVKDEATVDVLGMCLYASLYQHTFSIRMCDLVQGITIYISAWAISVARSTKPGNARASIRGTGDRAVPTLFLCRTEKSFTMADRGHRLIKGAPDNGCPSD